MTAIQQTNSLNMPVVPQGQGERKLDQTDFLQLMSTQLQQQDPFDPVDNQTMVAQMAQFSSVAGISEMNASLRSIADQIAAQTALLGDIRATTLPTVMPDP
ncbi:MAG: flagellar hook capping protein [Sphingomonadales bacterium]|nr:flagellar hook capping protein [Sphingomonadales bacterium]MBK9005161.1 flagellar hook capping protein [Sphingomonadales bacterium]MBK9267105.1 flagellar hook capping protein [Sphingomonadales bacterium]MBP6433090.1 flagellar hook capping protein [Sphingorhabdus sp.]